MDQEPSFYTFSHFSWEFLNESCDIEESPTNQQDVVIKININSTANTNENLIDNICENSKNPNSENSYDNLPNKKIVLVKIEDAVKTENDETDAASNLGKNQDYFFLKN